MTWQDAALTMAGVIGGATAVVHGILVHRLMVRPMEAVLVADARLSAPIRRLVPPLLQFSTYAWLLGGLALIASPWFAPDARLTTGLIVGSLYLFGTVANCWGTRGRHPGWMLMAAALILIVAGLFRTGG